MVFSSVVFIFLFLPAVLICYYLSPRKYRNFVLLVFSLAFYGFGEPLYLLVMMFSILMNYLFGHFVWETRDKNEKLSKVLVALSVVCNLAMLGFFKYTNFFIDNLRAIPGLEGLQSLGIVLPIGISFYTFQSMSYAIDVFRRDEVETKSLVDFAMYVTFFPQLIAGPIVRYKTIAEQLRTRSENWAQFQSGVQRFLVGLAKKVILANSFGQLWDQYNALPPEQRSVVGAWVGILAFTFQIYFDFGGYSDMAIGLGRMFGFEFLINFDYPYTSRSITEFWRRWHISLGTWFREYLYIPLGGNRKGDVRTYLNLLIVWLLTGFWHGASWNFVLWGGYYALILIIEKRFLLGALEKAPRVLSTVYSLLLVVIGWVIFSFESISDVFAYVGNMFGAGGAGLLDAKALYSLSGWVPLLIVGAIASTPLAAKLFNKLGDRLPRLMNVVTPVLCVLALVICTAFAVDASYNPFLYFRF